MPHIMICGLNGAGKSTVARLIAAELGWAHRDSEDYWFIPSAEDPFAVMRSAREAEERLTADLARFPHLILSSVDGRLAPQARFAGIVHLRAPREIRLARVRARSLSRFGDRARPGGALYGREEDFLRLIADRDESRVTAWIRAQGAPTLALDGVQPPEESARWAAAWIRRLPDTTNKKGIPI